MNTVISGRSGLLLLLKKYSLDTIPTYEFNTQTVYTAPG